MFNAITGFISSIFSPAADLVDNLHTSEEEKLQLRNELANIQEKALDKIIELEQDRLEAISKVQVAEANSPHWIAAAWRPIASLAMVSIVIASSFQLIPQPDYEFYELAKVFLGAYAVSRTAEKGITSIANRFGK